jgi:hypothetical protein
MEKIHEVVDTLRRDGRYEFEDVVDLSETVSRKYGIELTLAEAQVVYNHITGILG